MPEQGKTIPNASRAGQSRGMRRVSRTMRVPGLPDQNWKPACKCFSEVSQILQSYFKDPRILVMGRNGGNGRMYKEVWKCTELPPVFYTIDYCIEG